MIETHSKRASGPAERVAERCGSGANTPTGRQSDPMAILKSRIFPRSLNRLERMMRFAENILKFYLH
jgi:hypothetical protein